MTVDEFCRTFKKCPVCQSRLVWDPGSMPTFHCEGYDTCFAGVPEIENLTQIGMAYLYYKEHYYHYFDNKMFIYLLDDAEEGETPKSIGEIICDDKLMVTLFSKPKNIQKYFLVS